MKLNCGRIISIILCAFFVLTLFSCADHSEKNPGGAQDGTNQMASAPETTNPDDAVNDPKQTTDAATTPPYTEAMNIEKGYNVTSEQTFTIIGEEKDQEITVTVRVATLKHENGEHALYFDYLNEYGAILEKIMWKGRCQLFLNNEGEIYIFRINAKNDLTSGSAEASIYCISDILASQSGNERLDRAKIVKVPSSYDASLNFSLDRSAAIAVYKPQFVEFFDKYDHLLTIAAEELTEEEKGKGFVYLIADSYSDAEKDMTYHPDSKTPRPNLEIKEVKEKYTIDYVVEIFSK